MRSDFFNIEWIFRILYECHTSNSKIPCIQSICRWSPIPMQMLTILYGILIIISKLYFYRIFHDFKISDTAIEPIDLGRFFFKRKILNCALPHTRSLHFIEIEAHRWMSRFGILGVCACASECLCLHRQHASLSICKSSITLHSTS